MPLFVTIPDHSRLSSSKKGAGISSTDNSRALFLYEFKMHFTQRDAVCQLFGEAVAKGHQADMLLL